MTFFKVGFVLAAASALFAGSQNNHRAIDLTAAPDYGTQGRELALPWVKNGPTSVAKPVPRPQLSPYPQPK